MKNSRAYLIVFLLALLCFILAGCNSQKHLKIDELSASDLIATNISRVYRVTSVRKDSIDVVSCDNNTECVTYTWSQDELDKMATDVYHAGDPSYKNAEAQFNNQVD